MLIPGDLHFSIIMQMYIHLQLLILQSMQPAFVDLGGEAILACSSEAPGQLRELMEYFSFVRGLGFRA